MLFLHGLEDNGVISCATLERFKAMEKQLENNPVLLIFPLGCLGAFPDQEGALGWCPNSIEKNMSFLDNLISTLKKDYRIKSVLIGGFSNGAYFVSELLERPRSALFQGFWLQGGGKPLANLCHLSKQSKIVLEVGVDDQWHFSTVQLIKDQLISLKTNLIFRELKGGHQLNIDYFDSNLNFLRTNF